MAFSSRWRSYGAVDANVDRVHDVVKNEDEDLPSGRVLSSGYRSNNVTYIISVTCLLLISVLVISYQTIIPTAVDKNIIELNQRNENMRGPPLMHNTNEVVKGTDLIGVTTTIGAIEVRIFILFYACLIFDIYC